MYLRLMIISSLILFLSGCVLSGCGDNGGESSQEDYIVSYRFHESDERKSITPIKNEFFSIEDIPSEFGYEFKGFYVYDDSGDFVTRFVNQAGESLRRWDNNGHVDLIAKWEPITFSIQLNLEGGSSVSDSTTLFFEVAYGQSLPSFEALEVVNENGSLIRYPGFYFDGFYSRQFGLGERYSDSQSWLPSKRVFTIENFPDAFNVREGNIIHFYARYIR